MTVQEELQDIQEKAESAKKFLLTVGSQATVLFKLEQVIKLCRSSEPTIETVNKARNLMWSLAQDTPPN